MAKIDKTSGSMAYNRLDMQVSQSLLFAIELHDSLDYLIVLDYYDDISIFDDQQDCTVVSYYQMKTSDKEITIHTVLEEEWLLKMYEHLTEPNLIVRELGLITNQNIMAPKRKKIFSYDKTKFDSINSDTKQKICEDIAKRKKITPEKVDLTKFIHLKTILTIDSHRDLAEKKMMDFLQKNNPKMSISVAKTIYATLFEVLSCKQAHELPEDAMFEAVKAHKSFSKHLVDKVIDISSVIEIPQFPDIIVNNMIPKEYVEKAAMAYTNILADSNRNDAVFHRTFDELRKIIQETTYSKGELIWDFAGKCFELYSVNNSRNIHVMSADLYINVLILCILVKGDS